MHPEKLGLWYDVSRRQDDVKIYRFNAFVYCATWTVMFVVVVVVVVVVVGFSKTSVARLLNRPAEGSDMVYYCSDQSVSEL
jgi:hypothetical protein